MKEMPICEKYKVDKKKTERIKEELKPNEIYISLAETFKALGDPTRVKILQILFKRELCVCEICEILQISQSAVSHQLRILRNMKLVKYRREGRSIFYSLDDEHIEHLFKEGLNHIEEE